MELETQEQIELRLQEYELENIQQKAERQEALRLNLENSFRKLLASSKNHTLEIH